MRVEFHSGEVHELANDLGRVPYTAQRRVSQEGTRVSSQLHRRWVDGATESSGAHGVHYPDAITVEKVGVLAWEAGPEAGRPQGGMSFETGSRNQPPHLDGNNAADVTFPLWERAVADAVEGSFR